MYGGQNDCVPMECGAILPSDLPRTTIYQNEPPKSFRYFSCTIWLTIFGALIGLTMTVIIVIRYTSVGGTAMYDAIMDLRRGFLVLHQSME